MAARVNGEGAADVAVDEDEPWGFLSLDCDLATAFAGPIGKSGETDAVDVAVDDAAVVAAVHFACL
jgi:hypothetical protein